MNTTLPEAPAFPLFICGLPRAGTSFLFAVLSEHPAFANPHFKDKELRYFEKLIGNRPWSQVEGVSQKKFEGIDADILPALLRTLDERLRAARGGAQGHYINANPRDVFLSRILLETIPDAKFIVALRDPLTQIWSALNYPSSTWGVRSQGGFFREEDVRRSAEHWNKVSFFIQRDGYRDRPASYFLLEQEHLAEATPELHLAIEAFVGLAGIARLLDERANTVIHSSFLDDQQGKGRDREFEDHAEKLAHFRESQLMFTEDPRYTRIVLDVCGAQLEHLMQIGLMRSGPASRLLGSHKAIPEAAPGAERLSSELYRRTARFLLERLGDVMPGRVLVLGAAPAGSDPLAQWLASRAAPGTALLRHTARQIAPLRVAPTVAGLEVLQIDCIGESPAVAMKCDFVASRPRLVLMPAIGSDDEQLPALRNAFVNLGYTCARIGASLIAARRDTLDTTLEAELQGMDGRA